MSDKLPKTLVDMLGATILNAKADSLEEVRPLLAYVAKAQRIKFTELKRVGFSQKEALELCKGTLFPNLTDGPSTE